MARFAGNNTKYVKRTIYKYVSEYVNTKTRELFYMARLYSPTKGLNMCKSFTDLREAALCVDKYLINKGKEPVNILKRK